MQQWWREKARPALGARLTTRRARRSSHRAAITDAQRPTADEPATKVVTSDHARVRMSSAEAKARLVAALAAEAYSKEQLRLVTTAQIVDGGSFAELQQALAKLPSPGQGPD